MRSWMTKTGSILLTVAGIAGSCAQVVPIPRWAPWLNFGAVLLGGLGAALTGQGIRRRLPDGRGGTPT